MQQDRNPGAAQRARAFLLRHFQASPSAAPRSIVSLAAEASVSYVTMWQAVRQMKAEGSLIGSYRVGASGEPMGSPGQSRENLSHFDRIRTRFIDDLLSGVLTCDGVLLSSKELSCRYASSPGTVRRLLECAWSEKLLVPHGRHWASTTRSFSGRLSIVLIVYVESPGILRLPSLEQQMVGAFEAACEQAQLKLIMLGLCFDSKGGHLVELIGMRSVTLPRGDGIAGYAYAIHLPQAYDARFASGLLSTRKPVAFLDNGSGVSLGDTTLRTHSLLRVFTISSHRKTGIAAAAFALARGHRHVAYISPFHADDWSKVRYDGIAQSFAAAGQQFTCRLYAQSSSIKGGYYASDGRRHCNGDRLVSFVKRWRSQAPRCFHRSIDSLTNWDLGEHVFQQGEIREALEALLDQAVRHKDTTAWILANDTAASMALDYCNTRGIRVPRDVAIIGFDDDIRSRERRITSYDCNFGAAAQSILNFLLHPASTYWQEHRVVEIEGRIVERASFASIG